MKKILVLIGIVLGVAIGVSLIPVKAQVNQPTGSATPSGPAGGVLSGSYPNPGLSASATAIPNGWTATTQAASDNSTNVATTAYVSNQIAAGGATLTAANTLTGFGTGCVQYPCLISTTHLTAQTASLGATTAYTNSTGATVNILASCIAHTTTAGSAGTVTCGVLTPDSFAVNSATTDLTTTSSSRGTQPYGMSLLNTATLRYQTTVSSASGSPQYELYVYVFQTPR